MEFLSFNNIYPTKTYKQKTQDNKLFIVAKVDTREFLFSITMRFFYRYLKNYKCCFLENIFGFVLF